MCQPQTQTHYSMNLIGKRPRSLMEDDSSNSSCITIEISTLEEKLNHLEQPRKRARITSTKRRVHFSLSSPKIAEASSPLDQISQEEVPSLWYQRTDIKLNQMEARNHILFGQQLETTRGYERYQMDRVKNKALALKCTLLIAQQKTLSQEEIAQVAQECTAVARRQAVLTGAQDFFGAYFDQ